jgi:hypothetical protein
MTTPTDIHVCGHRVAGIRPLCRVCLAPLNKRRIVHRCVRCGEQCVDKDLVVFELVERRTQ